ncbi:hypothetical protein P7C71_g388, partial [Lecanoromycetidae sp. Uapishka_2]
MDFTSFNNIIDGEPRESATTNQGINPATEEKLFDVPIATESDLNDAVASARRAFTSWSQTSFEERCELVRKYAEAYMAQESNFTDLLMKENGKPRAEANREIHSSYEGMLVAANWELPVETMEDENKTATVRYVPLGVVGAICPWNFPLVLSFTKIAPALVAGNCVIVKPSPYTPYTTLKAVEVGHSLFPPGVLQVLGGDEKLGPWIVSHPDIQKISFTGSIPTGKKIMAECAKTLKRVTLELGGNDASIVCPDVDIEETASAVAMAAFKNAGQICVASKRIYVHETIYRSFLKAMVSFTESLRVGNPFDEGIKVGPIQNSMQYEKVQTFFTDCKEQGYTFATDNSKIELPSKGYFIQPTIIENPPSDSKIVTEEPFGPIIPVQLWNDEADVIRRTNDTKTGLGACIWSKDIKRAERIARQLEVGSIYINSPLRPDWKVYFSGHKESGIGGERGLMGLLAYCNAQAVHVHK